MSCDQQSMQVRAASEHRAERQAMAKNQAMKPINDRYHATTLLYPARRGHVWIPVAGSGCESERSRNK